MTNHSFSSFFLPESAAGVGMEPLTFGWWGECFTTVLPFLAGLTLWLWIFSTWYYLTKLGSITGAMTFRIKTFGVTTLWLTTRQNDIQHNNKPNERYGITTLNIMTIYTECCHDECHLHRVLFKLRAVMLRVIASHWSLDVQNQFQC